MGEVGGEVKELEENEELMVSSIEYGDL